MISPSPTFSSDQAPPTPASTTGPPVEKWHRAGQVLPAVDVDVDEDRLGEEEDPFERKREAEDVPETAHELGPEQAHLEREHRSSDRADDECHARDLRPALSQPERDLVASPQAEVVGDQDDRRKGNPDARQDDLKAERERHLRARRAQLGRDREEVEAL